MTSKERFLATLNHKASDKIVVDFGATAVSGIHVLAIENLRKHYGLEKKPVKTLIISNKGEYKRVNSSLLTDFEEGEYLIRSMMIGNGLVEINYAKMDDGKVWSYLQKRGLEDLSLSKN